MISEEKEKEKLLLKSINLAINKPELIEYVNFKHNDRDNLTTTYYDLTNNVTVDIDDLMNCYWKRNYKLMSKNVLRNYNTKKVMCIDAEILFKTGLKININILPAYNKTYDSHKIKLYYRYGLFFKDIITVLETNYINIYDYKISFDNIYSIIPEKIAIELINELQDIWRLYQKDQNFKQLKNYLNDNNEKSI